MMLGDGEEIVNNNDIEREKYLRLITQVEELEDQVASLEKQKKGSSELREAEEELAAARPSDAERVQCVFLFVEERIRCGAAILLHEIVRDLAPRIVDQDGETGLHEAGRHRPAHVADADETDCWPHWRITFWHHRLP